MQASLVDSAKKEHPFLVTMPHGKGKVVFLASGELWRLRMCESAYHDRLWWNLAQYAVGQSSAGSWLGVRAQAIHGETVTVEIRLVDGAGKPITADARPRLRLTPRAGADFPRGANWITGADFASGVNWIAGAAPGCAQTERPNG